MQDQLDIFVDSLNQFWLQLVHFVPRLLAVIVILFIGWLVAKVIRKAVKRGLELAQFDKFAQKSGLEAFMSHGNFSLTFYRFSNQFSNKPADIKLTAKLPSFLKLYDD